MSRLFAPDVRNFNPLAPHGARHLLLYRDTVYQIFQSTRPARGETVYIEGISHNPFEFQSTRPARGETGTKSEQMGRNTNFNPLAPHGARPAGAGRQELRSKISIHSPRTGRDADGAVPNATALVISIHSPRTGRDQRAVQWCRILYIFQSTRPARGETQLDFWQRPFEVISIHSPRTGRDNNNIANELLELSFQSTRPARGETFLVIMDVINIYYFNPLAPHGARRRAGDTAGAGGVKISIHSPRTGRDLPARRLPRMLTVFQSTRPARGETAGGDAALGSQHISIHSPRTGRDLIHAMSTYPSTDFNPLAPHGARHRFDRLRERNEKISIHSPRTGRDA